MKTVLLIWVTSLQLSLRTDDRLGTKDDRALTFLHPSQFSAFRWASTNFKPVHSVMLSFLFLPAYLCPSLCRALYLTWISTQHEHNLTTRPTSSWCSVLGLAEVPGETRSTLMDSTEDTEGAGLFQGRAAS